jgi:hypothetical protein
MAGAAPSVVGMTALDTSRRRGRWAVTGCRRTAVLSSAATTSIVWALARAADVDLVVRSGGGTSTVGWASVLVASALATLAGLALLEALERRQARGRQVWTGVAIGVFLASLVAGPAAATGVAAGLTLAAMHAVVLVVLLDAAWRCPVTTLKAGGEVR